MASTIPHAAEELDLHLAEEILEGAASGVQLALRRDARNLYWIRGLMGFRGLHVTGEDVKAVLEHRPGRFRPEHPEFAWIRGFLKAIDEIDRRADFGEEPDGFAMLRLFELLGAEQDRVSSTLRTELPWDRIAGVEYRTAQEVEAALEEFPAKKSQSEERRALHPIQRAAAICKRFVELSPFWDFNLPMACMAASWTLLAAGYPPFLVHAADRATFADLIVAPSPVWEQWVAEIVLTVYVSPSS